MQGLTAAQVHEALKKAFEGEGPLVFASTPKPLTGGDAELHVWPGGVHAFDFLAPWAALSRAARAERVAWLSRVLARS